MLPSVRRLLHALVVVAFLLLVLLSAPRVVGQAPQPTGLTPETGQPIGFAVSVAVRDLPPDVAAFRPRDPDENADGGSSRAPASRRSFSTGKAASRPTTASNGATT
jgi:hypothetical protein